MRRWMSSTEYNLRGLFRYLAGDGETVRPGRARRVWVLRPTPALLLGHEALPGLHQRRDATDVVSRPPQDRRTRGRGRTTRTQRQPRPRTPMDRVRQRHPERP